MSETQSKRQSLGINNKGFTSLNQKGNYDHSSMSNFHARSNQFHQASDPTFKNCYQCKEYSHEIMKLSKMYEREIQLHKQTIDLLEKEKCERENFIARILNSQSTLQTPKLNFDINAFNLKTNEKVQEMKEISQRAQRLKRKQQKERELFKQIKRTQELTLNSQMSKDALSMNQNQNYQQISKNLKSLSPIKGFDENLSTLPGPQDQRKSKRNLQEDNQQQNCNRMKYEQLLVEFDLLKEKLQITEKKQQQAVFIKQKIKIQQKQWAKKRQQEKQRIEKQNKKLSQQLDTEKKQNKKIQLDFHNERKKLEQSQKEIKKFQMSIESYLAEKKRKDKSLDEFMNEIKSLNLEKENSRIKMISLEQKIEVLTKRQKQLLIQIQTSIMNGSQSIAVPQQENNLQEPPLHSHNNLLDQLIDQMSLPIQKSAYSPNQDNLSESECFDCIETLYIKYANTSNVLIFDSLKEISHTLIRLPTKNIILNQLSNFFRILSNFLSQHNGKSHFREERKISSNLISNSYQLNRESSQSSWKLSSKEGDRFLKEDEIEKLQQKRQALRSNSSRDQESRGTFNGKIAVNPLLLDDLSDAIVSPDSSSSCQGGSDRKDMRSLQGNRHDPLTLSDLSASIVRSTQSMRSQLESQSLYKQNLRNMKLRAKLNKKLK